MSQRLTAVDVVAFICLLPIARARSAPPEEIRIGSLGPRGVAFTEERPGTFADAISAAGDVNGDGKADLLLLHLDISLDYEPTVFLVYGKSGLPQSIKASELKGYSTTFRRSTPRLLPSDLIRGMAPAGDVDGDGFDDFFIFRPDGAPENYAGGIDALPGLVYLVHGAAALPPEVGLDAPPAGVRFTLFTSTKATGTGLCQSASVGDLNGDGKSDLAFGASGSALEAGDLTSAPGRVYVLFGGAPFTGVVDVEEAGRERPGVIIEGDEDSAGMGTQVIFAGDVNGDGFGDLLVGARSGLGWRPSWAYIVFGAASFPRILTVADLLGGYGVRFVGTAGASFTGWALGAPGDLNGDGLADFVIGAHGAAGQKGEAYFIYGQRSFASDIQLAEIASAGIGVTFRGEEADVFGGDFAGCSLATVDFLGHGRQDIVMGAWGSEYRGIPRIGKAYVIDGSGLEPGVRSLAEVEEGSLAGALLTTEVSLTASQRYEPRLGMTVAAVGDVDGDGHEDLLVSAPSYPSSFDADVKAGVVYLVYGGGGAADPLRLERVEPDTVAVRGGRELTLIGAGLDETVEVRIGGAPAPVKHAITSARLVVEAPPLARTGPMDVVATRGAETATLLGGVRYVARVHDNIDVLALPKTGNGTIVRGISNDFGLSLAFVDIDKDGFSDVVASSGTGSLVIIYGSARPAGELELPDLEGGDRLEGVSLIRTPPRPSCEAIGDVNGDGQPDLAVRRETGVTVLFPDGRYPDATDLDVLVQEGRGANILNGGPSVEAVAGGGDIDGDQIDDLAVAVGDYQSPYAVYFVKGHKDWPLESFLEDMPHVTSSEPKDYLGSALAVPGDLDGDGLVEVLAGAPRDDCCNNGYGYVIFGGEWPLAGGRSVQDLFSSGSAARFDAFKAKDGLGYTVCAPGDMNGDGAPDLALSALDGGVSYQGECYVVFDGPDIKKEPGGAVVSMAALGGRGLRILGEHPSDFAVHMAPAGDFNGDGLKDLLIGAPTPMEPQGKAYVVFGGPACTVRLYDLGADGVRITGVGIFQLGYTVLGGGDFNGDGHDDIIITDAPRLGSNASLFIVFGEEAPGTFIRGDSNNDRKVQLSDAVFLLGYLFLGSAAPPCLDAADGNDDGALSLTDAIYVLSHLFLGGAAPPAPFPGPGQDLTADALGCEGTL